MGNSIINKLETLDYRPNVCVIILNDANQIFIGKRANSEQEVWQLPQGGIDENEELITAALREAHEELGADLKHFVFVQSLESVNFYDFKQPPAYAIGRWRGQRQNFAILKFTGQDQDLKLDRFEVEFEQYAWVDLEQLKNTVEPQRLKGYENALKEVEQFLGTLK